MLLASPAGRAELERWPQYSRGAVAVDASGRCHVKLGVFQVGWKDSVCVVGGVSGRGRQG